MRTSTISFCAVFALGLVVIAWQEYFPSSAMFDAMGMAGPTARSGRECSHYVRDTFIGRVPVAGLVCEAPVFGRIPMPREDANMNDFTREVTHAERQWFTADSAEWAKQQDSIATKFAHLGAQAASCSTSSGRFPRAVVNEQWWEFPTFYIRLVAYDRRRDFYAPDSVFPRWTLQLDGYSELPFFCDNR